MFGWLRREPSHLAEHRRRAADALADYPIYEPPHRQGPNCPRHLRNQGEAAYRQHIQEFDARGRENFSYFMEHRHARLTTLTTFLAKFGVTMGVDDVGLAAVSAWCPGNCGALVANLRQDAMRQVFFQLAPWTGQYRGFNVIFDLGIFFGECVTARNRSLHWIYKPGSSDDGSAILSGYEIAGFRDPRDWLDPMSHMYTECENAEVELRSGKIGRIVHADVLAGKVRDFASR